MKVKYNILQILYIFMIFFGIFLGFGATLGYFKGRSTLSEWILGLIIMGFVPLIFGIILLVKIRKKLKDIDTDTMENKVFQLAKKNGSVITIADLAMDTQLTIDQAKKVLDDLCIKGFAEMMVSESGVIVYNFKSIISDSEKKSSERI